MNIIRGSRLKVVYVDPHFRASHFLVGGEGRGSTVYLCTYIRVHVTKRRILLSELIQFHTCMYLLIYVYIHVRLCVLYEAI